MAKKKTSRSKREIERNPAKEEFELRVRIAAVLMSETALSIEAADEAAFHMTDWLVDLKELVRLYLARKWDSRRAMDVFYGFFVHAPQHLNAAHLILMGYPVTDPFELGAVKGSGRGRRQPGQPYPEPTKGKRRKVGSSRAQRRTPKAR
jgi:hypothetical protein